MADGIVIKNPYGFLEVNFQHLYTSGLGNTMGFYLSNPNSLIGRPIEDDDLEFFYTQFLELLDQNEETAGMPVKRVIQIQNLGFLDYNGYSWLANPQRIVTMDGVEDIAQLSGHPYFVEGYNEDTGFMNRIFSLAHVRGVNIYEMLYSERFKYGLYPPPYDLLGLLGEGFEGALSFGLHKVPKNILS